MLTQAQLDYRQGKITATLARDIMNARTDAEMLAIFDTKIGAIDPEPENYQMRLGAAAEGVLLHEYELMTGEVLTRRQETVDHAEIKNFCATIDAWSAVRRAVVEAKFVTPHWKHGDIFNYYYPQVAFQIACTDAAEGVLLVGQGTNDPVIIECIRDRDYERELIERCETFLLCLKTMSPPCARPVVIPPEKWRTVDVTKETTNWSSELLAALVEYDETTKAAEAHEHWGTVARELVPDDVGKVIAGDFTLSRNKRGVVTIRRAAA